MPRLAKTLDASQSSSERNRDSVIQLYWVLATYAEGKKVIPEAIVSACGKQERLAALSMPERRVQRMSLNTLKKAARAITIDGQDGWKELEKVRRKVLQLGQAQKGRKRSNTVRRKSSLVDKVKEIGNLLEQSIRARAALTRAYSELLAIARHAAKQDPATAQRLKRHLITFGDHGFRPVAEDDTRE